MPPFGSRKARPPETSPPPEPEPQAELSARQRYEKLLADRAELETTIASHREERERLLYQEEVPALGAITALATQTEAVQLQLEWLNHKLPALQEAVAEEQRAQWEAAYQSHRPRLAEAQTRLADAITEFHAALHTAHVVFNGSAAFGNRVSDEFVRPVPQDAYNRWALVQYLRTIERRRQPQPMPAPEVWLDVPLNLLPAERFKPRRVDPLVIEQISPLLPARRIRVEHGPVKVSNLATSGYSRLLPGQEVALPARAAAALVMSGCAVYTDAEAAEATAA